MELVLATGAALTVAMLVLGTRVGAGDRLTRARIDHLRIDTEFGLPAEVIPAPSPRRRHLSGVVLRLAPPRLVRATEELIERGGATFSVGQFLGLWVAVSTASLAVALTWAVSAERDLITRLGPAALVGATMYVPWFLLRRRATIRQRAINRALPQVLDIIVTNIECGLGLQAAMLMVADKFPGPIAVEFSRAMREIGVGVRREDALNAMARRTGSSDVAGVARAIAQAERSGVSIGEILRARARELREHRRLLAREQANKVPVKMTLPMVLFIFPTFFMLLLAPVAMNAAEMMK